MTDVLITIFALSPILLLVFGLWWWSLGIFKSLRRAKKQWVRLPIEIHKSDMIPHKHHQAFLKIQYSYAFQDKEYRADQVFYKEDFSMSVDSAKAIHSQYPIGESAFCYVNPCKPGQSALLLKVNPAAYIYAAIGLLLSLPFLYVILKSMLRMI